MLYALIKTLVLPPTLFFLLLLLGLLLKRRGPRVGRIFLSTLLFATYLATTPYVAGELMHPLQTFQPVDPRNVDPGIEAILVLGAGVDTSTPEYCTPETEVCGVDIADALTLQRVEYAAYLAKVSGIRVMVSGGPIGSTPGITLAQVMNETMQRDFGLSATWVEDRSDSTRTNAVLSAEKLRGRGIGKIYLVTHAWHMRRAVLAFEGTGIEIIPAPTRFVSRADPQFQDFVPSAKAFLVNYYAIHEWLGLVWYKFRS